MEKTNKEIIAEQAKTFVQEVCIGTWEMSEQEIENYCLLVAKQNMLMAGLNKDYLPTALAYMQLGGLSKTRLKNISAEEVK